MAAVPPCHYFRALRGHPDLNVPENDRYRGPRAFLCRPLRPNLSGRASVTGFIGARHRLSAQWRRLIAHARVVLAKEFCLYLACRQPDLPAVTAERMVSVRRNQSALEWTLMEHLLRSILLRAISAAPAQARSNANAGAVLCVYGTLDTSGAVDRVSSACASG